MRAHLRSVGAAACVMAILGGCAAPVLTRDGQLVFQQSGARGASVITAHGVEFLDRAELPRHVARRSVDEPFRPATGFLLPKDGVLRKTSTAVPVQGPGLAVVLRSSDAIVPSWGGEILLRLDAIAPAAAFPRAAASARPPERVVLVIDGDGLDTMALADAAIEDLSGADRVAILDAARARTVLPPILGSHRTLLHAATERLLAQSATSRPRDPAARNLAGALATARGFLSAQPGPVAGAPLRHVLILTDGVGVARGGAPLDLELRSLAAAGVEVSAVATTALDASVSLRAFGAGPSATGLIAERIGAVQQAVPPPGDVVLDDVMLAISAVPAPARVIEVSGGEASLGLDADHLSFGELYVGEARTEVARIVLPPWVPGESLELTVTATFRDAASGKQALASATLRCMYSADVEEIADARHGDVIAYASALAMVRRLHRAFLGNEGDRLGGVRRIAALQAKSLDMAARVQHDAAMGKQAEMLTTLLGVLED